ncbi:hypothetical protein HMPREF3201_00308 [Megasphaera sp. MJR8396C]|nr:hypothetical protein HMPREF3201_00308 [Megasphaera sp. MJR8396C]
MIPFEILHNHQSFTKYIQRICAKLARFKSSPRTQQGSIATLLTPFKKRDLSQNKERVKMAK